MSNLEKTVAAFGGWPAWNASLPARHWIPTTGGWASHARNRCTDDCEEGLKPLDNDNRREGEGE